VERLSTNYLEASKERSKQKLEILESVKNYLEKSKDILSARIYGSWLFSEKSIDLDICTIIPSRDGVIDADVYSSLKDLRKMLCEKTKQDVDLVPHTTDEIEDLRSTLYYPRYNPALISGVDIKGKLNLEPIFNKNTKFDFGDLTAYILLDNRTICRRQLVRSLNPEESKIFVSKILHGPGNAVTYHSCKNKKPYQANPSNFKESLTFFDEIFKVNSKPAEDFLQYCRKDLDFEKAAKLMQWYEHMVSLVLYKKGNYEKFCLELSKIKFLWKK